MSNGFLLHRTLSENLFVHRGVPIRICILNLQKLLATAADLQKKIKTPIFLPQMLKNYFKQTIFILFNINF
jgi:hypothetical protein